MRQDFSAIKENLNNFVLSFFIPVLKSKIDDALDFIHSFKKELANLGDLSADPIKEISEYNKRTSLLVEKRFTASQPINFNEEFPRFYEELNNYLSGFDEIAEEVQPAERFTVNEQDTIFIKNSKRIKKLSNGVSQIPVRVTNIPRKII